MKFLIIIYLMLKVAFCYRIVEVNILDVDHEKDWWEAASFYQIYPRSFRDSNGDGIGDINGISEKLHYLRDLGITAFWLSPIYKSPMADFGYDISNYFEIQPEYGTMKDFENLLRKSKELGIRIIMDFVPNHSSDENEWFIKSVNKEPGFEDFYIWHPGYVNSNDSSRIPPSNWISQFWHSAWQWNEQRQEYYYHQFHRKQPDLNYRSPKVIETIKSVLRFWLDKGVDGFRVDAIPPLFEIEKDKDGRYKDEPLSGWTNNSADPSYLLHYYTQDQDESLDMVYQWRSVLDQYQKEHQSETKVMMTESYSNIDTVMKYYGNNVKNGSEIPFNFYMIMDLHNNFNARDIESVINLWLNKMPKTRIANWVIGNHDQKRVGSRFGEDYIDIMNMIIQILPGISITYNGEEIGMTNVWISWNDTVDPAACNTNPSVYEQYSRDPERTPFQWNNSTSAGFSSSNKTWLPVSPKYKEINVENQNSASNSHLKIYKKLIELRQSLTIQYGETLIKVFEPNVIVIKRELLGASIVVVANFGSQSENVNLNLISNLPNQMKLVIVSTLSEKTKGSLINTSNLILEPKESLVLSSF